ncbi:MAG: HlyD family efflux transporter periplasmic adaptor subunit, partial [Gemmataceae bacterium]|nr:HlyD family efflux transporter periplasmic adaptor subunit [Gemmataceae bacterium]
MELNQQQKRRLEGPTKSGAIAEVKLLDLDRQYRLLEITAQACRQDLLARGLTAEQIEGIARGKYVTAVTVHASSHAHPPRLVAAAGDGRGPPGEERLDVQELKVQLGDQVQAGQPLCVIADHRELLIEGRAFRREAPLLEQAAGEGWPVRVESAEEGANGWSPLDLKLKIQYFATTVDPDSQTLPFFLPFRNESKTYQKGERALLAWRFRPGQRVRLHVPVEELKDVIVLPAGAVVWEGPEAYVFRQNGDLFDRRPVHVRHEDRLHVVLANDGSIA